MAKKKTSKVQATKRENKTDPYVKGDFCYYLDANNKIQFAEVLSAHPHEQTDSFYYQIVDQKEFKFAAVHHDHCADTEKELKGVKR